MKPASIHVKLDGVRTGQGLRVPFADISLIDEGGLDIRLGNSLEVADSRRLSLEGGCLGLRHRTLVQDALLIRWPGLRKRPA